MEMKEENIKLARFVAGAIGFKPQVYPYYDDSKKNSLDILSLHDPIDEKVKFYCTIGLSDFPNLIEMKNGENQNVPVEVLIVGYEKFQTIPNILSTSAFYLIKNKWDIQPGTIFKNMVDFYHKNLDLKHVLFTAPFLWHDKLLELKLDTKNVNFLLGILISEAEMQFKIKNGKDALLNMFQHNKIDIYDLNRKSIL